MSTDDGNSPWESMARELAQRPNSPASLRIMSALSRSVAPVQAAVAVVKRAIFDQVSRPGPEADAAFASAKLHWERLTCGEMDAGLESELRKEVEAERLSRNDRRGPPDINQVIAVREQFETALGRAMTEGEWSRLETDVSAHAAQPPNELGST